MIGVNTFCLFDNIAKDLPSTFRAVRDTGIEALEIHVIPVKKQNGLPAGVTAQNQFSYVFAQAKEHQLQVPSVHMYCSVGNLIFPKSWTLRTIRKLHDEYGVENFVFSGMFTDAAGAKRWAKYLRKVAAAVKGSGCNILYHNHSQEFNAVEVNGSRMTALDYFFSMTGPDVYLQLDIGWAGISEDEVELAKRYRDRVMSIHLKDFVSGTRGNFGTGNMPKERFAAIGNGEIRTAEVLAIRNQFPHFNGSIIIDQDHSITGILEDLRIGYLNVVSMLKK